MVLLGQVKTWKFGVERQKKKKRKTPMETPQIFCTPFKCNADLVIPSDRICFLGFEVRRPMQTASGQKTPLQVLTRIAAVVDEFARVRPSYTTLASSNNCTDEALGRGKPNPMAMFTDSVGRHCPWPRQIDHSRQSPISWLIVIPHESHAMIKSRTAYLTSRSLTSKINLLLGGIPGTPLLPYARWAGIVRRRSPPMAMPATPISQPLITSPLPSLKEKGGPFLFAVSRY